MNILICNYEYPPLGGGGGVTTKRLAEELAKKHAVSVLTSAFGDLPKCEVVNHVTIYRGPILGRNCTQTASLLSMLLYWPASLLKGLRLCQRETFDVINSPFAIPTGVRLVV